MIKASWCSRLMLRAKVFIWRVIVGVLPLGDALKMETLLEERVSFVRWNIVGIDFGSCKMFGMVWRCINLVWMSLTRVGLVSFCWFSHIWKAMNRCLIYKFYWSLNHEERELYKVTYHHIRHLNWCVSWD